MAKSDDKESMKACIEDSHKCSNKCYSAAASMLQSQETSGGPNFACLGNCFVAEDTCMAKCDDKEGMKACVEDSHQCSNKCYSAAASMLQIQETNRGPNFACLGNR